MILVLELHSLSGKRSSRAELSRAAHTAAVKAAGLLDSVKNASSLPAPVMVAKNAAGRPILKKILASKKSPGSKNPAAGKKNRAGSRAGQHPHISVSHLKNSVAAIAARSDE